MLSYCNDLMRPGNIFFHEAMSGRKRMLSIARQTFLADRWYQQHVNYGREYWRKFAHRLPAQVRARCFEFYDLDPSECESSVVVEVSEENLAVGTTLALLLEADLRDPSLSLSSESESSGSVGLANLADQRMAIGEIVTQESTVNSLAGFNTEWVDD